MTYEIITNEKKHFFRHLNNYVEDFFLIFDAISWIVLTFFFLVTTVCAFAAPEPFKPLSDGIAFLGITFSTLALFLYVVDKIRNRKNERKIDQCLEKIERMVQKWDFN